MRRVYIVIRQDRWNDENTIDGVYASREAASEHITNQRADDMVEYEIQEHEQRLKAPKVVTYWLGSLNRRDGLREVREVHTTDENQRWYNLSREHMFEAYAPAAEYVNVYALDREAVEKRIAEIAESWGMATNA